MLLKAAAASQWLLLKPLLALVPRNLVPVRRLRVRALALAERRSPSVVPLGRKTDRKPVQNVHVLGLRLGVAVTIAVKVRATAAQSRKCAWFSVVVLPATNGESSLRPTPRIARGGWAFL
jgi:hypothetical protein